MKIFSDEKKLKKYRLENGVEFYLIDEHETGLYHAFVVRDPQYGNTASVLWMQGMKQTISKITGIDDNLVITASTHLDEPRHIITEERINELINCQKCGSSNPKNAKYCRLCGDLLI